MMQPQDVSEKLLRLAVRASPSGILIANENGRIVFANQALSDMFGYGTDELLGQLVEVLIPEKNAETHRHHRDTFNANPSPRVMGADRNFNVIGKDGRIFPVEIGLRPDGTKEERLVVATVIDITQRKAIEDRLHRHEEHLEELVAERTHELHEAQVEKERVMEQLIQTEKMAAIGTLVSGVGHEINNPLYFILGMAEAIGDEKNTALCREYSEEIVKYCKQIAETVKNLSRYAQPGEKHELQHVDLNESISAAVQVAKRSLQSDAIEVRQNTMPVPGILAKPEEIQQVLFNIIRNGIQAMNGKGILEISSCRQDNRVRIQIRDQGSGMPKENLGKIFDPFYTTRGPDEGEGLGLYIVQQIVNKYDGTISVESQKGVGTTFTIQFPVAEAD